MSEQCHCCRLQACWPTATDGELGACGRAVLARTLPGNPPAAAVCGAEHLSCYLLIGTRSVRPCLAAAHRRRPSRVAAQVTAAGPRAAAGNISSNISCSHRAAPNPK